MDQALLAAYGPQRWWPSESPLETIVGACLTQGTSWKGVERSLANLRERGLLTYDALRQTPEMELRELIRPSGFMVRKAATVLNVLALLEREYQGSIEKFAGAAPAVAREQLLAVPGIGPETADAILLYALGMPAMVVDEYLRRVTVRHGLAAARDGYAKIQQMTLSAFLDSEDAPTLAARCNEFHALIVQVGKQHCGRTPHCDGCPLRGDLDEYCGGKPIPY